MRDKNKVTEEKVLEERVVTINRVTKVVKGGRRFRFSALVVVGDYKGNVGFGSGKAQEVPEAIKKAIEDAKKNMISVPIVKTTIPHEVVGEYGAGKVFLRPAQPVPELLLVVLSEVLLTCRYSRYYDQMFGSTTPINIVRATFAALKALRTVEQVARLRGKTPEEIVR